MTKNNQARIQNLDPTQRAIIISNHESNKKSTAVFAILALFLGGLGITNFFPPKPVPPLGILVNAASGLSFSYLSFLSWFTSVA